MYRIIRAVSMAMLLSAGCAQVAHSAPGKPVTTPAEVAAITAVTVDFQAALKAKDARKLSSLMLNSNILFAAPANDKQVAFIRKEIDPNSDGVRAGGYNDFVQFVKSEKRQIEEKFYDVKITQDGDMAWVMFDYEFLFDGVVQNHGIEAWQMVKRDGLWKIFSVTWSVNYKDDK
ncbi:MAG: nuclear transport factor 2 family protein [Duganella sp.]